MNELIERLEAMIRHRFPEAEVTLDAPRDRESSWWLDVKLADRELNIEWRPSKGFGVSARPDALYGELSDELYDSLDETFDRVKQLILSGAKTSAPQEMTLAELRRHREISQIELARRLDIQQATISRMERRSELLLGTLKNMVNALGGVLEIHARFPDEIIRIQFEQPEEPKVG